MRKTVVSFLSGCLLAAMAGTTAFAGANITVDANTGEILSQEDAFQRWYPASLTKLMTTYVAFRMIESGQVTLDTPIRISANAVKEPPSRSGYKAGTEMTLDNALKIMLVRSTNDVAMAIGETLGGSEEKFAALMNEEAKRLGMYGTHFVNPNGLHSDDHYSTARDLAVLTLHLRREYPQYAHYFDIEAIDYGAKKSQANYNALIGRFQGADGMKTGFVCPSGYNLIGSATRNGRTIVTVVLGEMTITSRVTKAADLLGKAFEGKGSGQTLDTLAPYGGPTRDVAVNMRPTVCSKQANASDSWDGKDAEGHLVQGSVYLARLDHEPKSEPIVVLPPKVNSEGMPLSSIPLPTPRPDRPSMTDASNVLKAVN
ncbi:D-alanyl-D-alanine carboxypeptidase [Phyllobacterium sp. YR620]|uniref:D-alanyl-D-alanine carboxypeptidase n=1 Tax=Phyllobacterium pellucidum TaxID=2740464 RepID=A0A849VTV7_9HYPH|nr:MULTISPECIES: D-alanyl-D-alanine carboxypeptidase family protein [Phyllobacterium]NTS32324.1 D-alanyl-D-alanine carboxypeptidase [Phyllobacterium pellucidum]UGY09729.1 D-alanyl-D-alanine carboxypeptidase [Phyllobacterium sp. T1018]SDP46426.1 D-alanyl-D-alanine carboxypeptidase [Phyllobacterium sp. YR620]